MQSSRNHYEMTPRQIAVFAEPELQEAFNLFDLDSNGRITCSELLTVMATLRQQTTKDEVEGMIKRADVDGNGTIEFEEFLEMMSERTARIQAASEEVQRSREEQEDRQAFSIFDINGDGLIDVNEIRQTMKNLGEELTEADIKAMIKAADKNGDGKIDFEEFQLILRAASKRKE